MRLIYLGIAFMVLLVHTSDAQRRKKKEEEKEEISEEVLLKAETSLIEAEKQMILENYAKAYDLFLVAKDLNPNDPAVYFKLAEVVVQNGDNEKGLEYISKAIELDDTNKFYWIFKAEILKSVGRYITAIDTYEQLIEKIPGTENYLFELAILYQYQNHNEEALETYNKAEEIFGRTIEVMREKQRIYLEIGDMDALMADWDKLIEENPLEPEYILEYSNMLVNNNYYEEASERLRNFIDLNPSSDRPYLLLSEIERKQGNLKEAMELLKRPISSSNVAIFPKIQTLSSLSNQVNTEDERRILSNLTEILLEAHPSEYEPYAFAGDLYMKAGDKEKALENYRIASALSPANFNIWQNIISLEVEKAEYDSLVEHAEKALEYFPNQAIFYFYGGLGYYFKGNFRRSTQLLEQGTKYTSDPSLLAVFYGQLGDAYNSMKEFEKSDNSYEKALENDPENDHALNNYSYFLSMRGKNLDKAVEMSEKLVQTYPDNATYLDTHGWVLYVMGEYSEAEKFLKQAVSLEKDGTILEHYGDVLFKLGQEDEALKYWREAKDAGGASDKIDEKISDKQLYE